MTMTYFKRYRMDVDLRTREFEQPQTTEPFLFETWAEGGLRDHAWVKWQSFQNEIDATVFPCLSSHKGCIKLMQDITRRGNFVPEATWLLTREDQVTGVRHAVGTIQGLLDSNHLGAIQNIGVLPEYRGMGLGSLLIGKALHGFQSLGCKGAHLEVTVQNTMAIKLYERLGFRRTETVFKVAEVPEVQVL